MIDADLTALAAEIHAQNVLVGWWDDWLRDKTARHNTAMMLVVSEIAEAMEGHRKGLMDDHLPQHKMFDVELADAMIRLLDLQGAYGIPIRGFSQRATSYAESVVKLTVPEQLFRLCHITTSVGDKRSHVSLAMIAVAGVALLNDVDLWKLVDEKRAYNAQRADHKRENRAQAGGKAY